MRILIVEDDADLAQFLSKGLQEEQHTVETASDGETGLILATEESYDLLIVDVMLPKLDGLTLSKRLRAKGIRTPILLLTARDSVDDKVAAPARRATCRQSPKGEGSGDGSRVAPRVAGREGNRPDQQGVRAVGISAEEPRHRPDQDSDSGTGVGSQL